jgi:hypothetical protein
MQVFSRAVDLATLTSSGDLGLYSVLTGSRLYFSAVDSLAAYEATSSFTSVARIVLAESDVVPLKLLDISAQSLYLLAAPGVFVDGDGQPLVGLDVSSSSLSYLQVSRLVEDSGLPNIVSVSLDLGVGVLDIELDEPIRANSVVITNFRLQASAIAVLETSADNGFSGDYYTLSGGVVETEQNFLRITLSDTDAAVVKLSSAIAATLSSCFLSIEYDAATDYAGNVLRSISSQDARPMDSLVADMVNPQLRSFTVDLSDPDEAILVLTFSEPVVEPSEADITAITLQSRYAQRDGRYFTLTGGDVSVPAASAALQVRLRLLASDRTAIMRAPGLLRELKSSYLICSSFVEDLSGNAMEPIVDGFALLSSKYTRDNDSPLVEDITMVRYNLCCVTYFMTAHACMKWE